MEKVSNDQEKRKKEIEVLINKLEKHEKLLEELEDQVKVLMKDVGKCMKELLWIFKGTTSSYGKNVENLATGLECNTELEKMLGAAINSKVSARKLKQQYEKQIQ